MNNRDKIYEALFGEIPKETERRLELLYAVRGKEKLENKVQENIKRLKKIRWYTLQFTWYTEPKPAQRPRVKQTFRGPHMYVPWAGDNKNVFGQFFTEEFPEHKIISTPMIFEVKAYLKTPTNFNRVEKVMAELGWLRPWGRSADTDNLIKSLTDITIDTLMTDDCLIEEVHGWKFYSIKPRVEYHLKYMSEFPEII